MSSLDPNSTPSLRQASKHWEMSNIDDSSFIFRNNFIHVELRIMHSAQKRSESEHQANSSELVSLPSSQLHLRHVQLVRVCRVCSHRYSLSKKLERNSEEIFAKLKER